MQNQFINFTKGISALCVFFFHFIITCYFANKNALFPWYLYTPAWTGVWIFFIVSGYLIGKGFKEGRYKTETLSDFKYFYLKRAVRILPVYFIVVLIDVLFINPEIYLNGSETLFRVLTFRIRNPYSDYMIGNLWFIATIIHLYLITPFVFKYILNPLQKCKKKEIINTSFLIVFILFFYILRHFWWGIGKSWDYYILVNWFCNLDLFFGAFIFSFLTDKNDNIVKRVMRPISFWCFIFFIIFNTFLMSLTFSGLINSQIVKICFPTVVFIIMICCIYAYDVEKEYYNAGSNIKEKCITFLKNPFLIVSYLGVISYGFYSCHCQIIYVLIKGVHLNYSIVLMIAFLFTLLWAIILHFGVEKYPVKRK